MNNSFKIILLVISSFFLQLNLVHAKKDICKAGQDCNVVYTKKDISKLEQKCKLNDASSCHRLGFLYINGKGVKQDYVKARKYSEKACNLNHGRGCHNLGYLYKNGLGIEKDPSEANKYYEKACDSEEKIGCDLLNTFDIPEIPQEVLFFIMIVIIIIAPDLMKFLKKLKNKKSS